jgi:small-conductance mechanosensitive channel
VRVGDLIDVDGMTGTVEEGRMRAIPHPHAQNTTVPCLTAR